MPSFLVTRRMSPELRARVLSSVRGRPRAGAPQRLSPVVARLRLVTIAVIVAAVALLLHVRQQRLRQLEQSRAALLQKVQGHAAQLTAPDRQLPTRVERAVERETAATYGGDRLPEALRTQGALAELLTAPTLYLRGPLEALSRAGGVAQVAPGSWTDAFVLCLLEPPDARSEKALRAKARVAHSRAAGESTAHVQRLAPVLEVLPLLSADWQQRIATSRSAALKDYERLYSLAPVLAALKAVKARQLLLVVDEPGDASTPAELDGERRHAVRVALSDLNDGEVELRFRHDVDPSWLSDATRAEHASGVDSCALALDLRKALGLGG